MLSGTVWLDGSDPIFICEAVNRPFHGSWKVTKLLHESEAKVVLVQLENGSNCHKKEIYRPYA